MDRFEHNDTAATATDLRNVSGRVFETALSIESDDPDWYLFTLPSAGRPGDTVSVTFNHALGDLDLELYGSDGTTLLDHSNGLGNLEEISLEGLAAGIYYVLVYEFSGASSPDYALAVAVGTQGTGGKDVLTGDDDANTFTGLGGDDAINGLGGIDTAVFTGVRADYTISIAGAQRLVNDLSPGRDGNDSLSSIERLRFSDTAVAFDIDGAAGMTAKILGAVFGRAEVVNEVYAGIGLYYVDAGMTYESLMQLAIDARLGAGASYPAVVDLLYTNVVGVPPGEADRGYFAGLLDSGAFSVPGLGVYAADYFLNLENINLVGLSEHGLEYLPYFGG